MCFAVYLSFISSFVNFLGTKVALAAFIIKQPDTSEEKLPTGKKPFVQLLPEIDAYIHLLCIVYLIDTKSYEKVSVLSEVALLCTLLTHCLEVSGILSMDPGLEAADKRTTLCVAICIYVDIGLS